MPINFQCDKCGYKSLTAVKHAGSIIICSSCHSDLLVQCPVCNLDVTKSLTAVKHIGSTVQCPACHEAVHMKCPCCNGDIIVPNANTLITPPVDSLDRKRETQKLNDSSIISVPNVNETGLKIKMPDPLPYEESEPLNINVNNQAESGNLSGWGSENKEIQTPPLFVNDKQEKLDRISEADSVNEEKFSHEVLRFLTGTVNAMRGTWEERREVRVPKSSILIAVVIASVLILTIIYKVVKSQEINNRTPVVEDIMEGL